MATLCSACGLHYIICLRGENQKRKGIVKCAEMVQEVLTLGCVINKEYNNIQRIFHNGKQIFFQGQMFISHTL